MENFDTSTFFQDLADLPLLVSEVGEKWKQPSLLKLTPTVTPSSKTTGPTSPLPRVKIKLEWPPRTVHPRRTRGQGSGYIQLHYCEKQTRSGKKSYEQYYYHYELKLKGKRVKRSAYIPKDKLDVVQEWDRKKLDVIVILQYLGKDIFS